MRSRLVHEAHGQRTIVAVLETGDEVMSGLQELAEREQISAASVTAIGAFKEAVVTFWDWDSKAYEDIPVPMQVEVLALNGDIALDQAGRPKLHLHTVLGRRDGAAIGGHLKEGHVRPTLEVVLIESPAHLRRRHDEATGLPLIDLGASGS